MKTPAERLKDAGTVVGTLPRGLKSVGAWWHWRQHERRLRAIKDAAMREFDEMSSKPETFEVTKEAAE